MLVEKVCLYKYLKKKIALAGEKEKEMIEKVVTKAEKETGGKNDKKEKTLNV